MDVEPVAPSGHRDAGVREIPAFEQQWFACGPGKRVGKAIAKIQSCRVTAALSEIAVGFARNSSLYLGHRLDDYLRLLDEVVEAATGDGIAGSVDDGAGAASTKSGGTIGIDASYRLVGALLPDLAGVSLLPPLPSYAVAALALSIIVRTVLSPTRCFLGNVAQRLAFLAQLQDPVLVLLAGGERTADAASMWHHTALYSSTIRFQLRKSLS